MEIHSLFSTPIAFFRFQKLLSNDESLFINNQETRKSMGNTMSTNVNILDNDNLLNIKKFINDSINIYFTEIYQPKTNCTLEITQSWINYTNPGEYHHKHDHPNSFLSGVFYINADKDSDSIFFFNRPYKQIQVVPKEFNIFNSDSWQFPVGTNDLILFPSSLEHMVTHTSSKQTRISLAFNTFIKGEIGDQRGLTNVNI